jgi:polyisoprenoid-binding protein YceI
MMFVRALAALFVACTSIVATASAQPTKFTIDNTHTSVIFGIGHLGLSYTYGRFNKVSGEFTLDPGDPTKSHFKVVIDAASVDSNDAKRDEHLRTAEFLDVEKFPTLEFESTSVTKTEKGLDVAGKLTLHGVTKDITMPLTKVGEGATPFGDYRAGFLTQFSLKRSDYDMKNLLNAVGDDVSITISFEGIKQP